MVLTLIDGAALVIGALLLAALVYGTFARTKWGINTRPPEACPSCGTAFARFPRRPADFGEALWGGFTCGHCGMRLDKWGRPSAAAPPQR